MIKKFFSVVMVCVIFFANTNFILAADNFFPEYQNPNDIMITRPTNNFKTYEENISLFGACDYDYPLYVNDKEVKYTEHGFFVSYEKLNDGENIFVLKNGEHEKQICVIKKTPESNPTKPNDKIKFFETKKSGVVTRDYISHRTRPDEANDDLIEPLVKGTLVNILGETDEYYFLSDKTFIYKESVDIFDDELEENKIYGIDFDLNSTEIKFLMDRSSLYQVNQNGNEIELVIFDSSLDENFDLALENNFLIEKMDYRYDDEKKSVNFKIGLNENTKTNGYEVKFEDNNLVLRLQLLPEVNSYEKNLDGVKIVVDAGHGGNDFGTLGPAGTKYLNEKDINLMIANKLAEHLKNLGAEVIMNRTDDIFVPLADRVKNIKENKPDFSISIHGNSRLETKDYLEVSGLIVYHTFNINNAPEFISRALSQKLDFVREHQISNLALTRITNCPAIVVETSFLSNPNDYERLINPEEQNKIAQAITNSVQEYFYSMK